MSSPRHLLVLTGALLLVACTCSAQPTPAPSNAELAAAVSGLQQTVQQLQTQLAQLQALVGRLPNQPPPAAPPPGTAACDETLWDHVYHAQRLHVIDRCETATGVIFSMKPEADGDTHIRLTLDPAFKSLLNDKNVSGQMGKLVIEPICVNPVTQADAIPSCEGFDQNLTTVKIGDRVSVTGAYVTDTQHGWNEIHPITSIKILP